MSFIINFIPLLFLLVIIGYLIYTVPKKEKPNSFYYAITILGVCSMLYYMMIFLNFEILGSYSLTNITNQEEKLLKVKDELDSLEIYRNTIMNDIEKSKIEMGYHLDKIAIYTNETAKTTLKMQSHLERLKEIEKTITDFDTKLSQITQKLIIFSFLDATKPLYVYTNIVDEYRNELEEITLDLGQQLNFDADSLIRYIDKRSIDLNIEHDRRIKK